MEIGLITTDFLGKLSDNIEFPYVSNDDLLLVKELKERDFQVTSINWGADLSKYLSMDVYLVRSPLDYILDKDKFITWLDELRAHNKLIINSFSTINWNCDKSYLADLAKSGVSVIPTKYVERDNQLSLIDHIGDLDWEDIVIKRTVSAGAHFMNRVKRDDYKKFEKKFMKMRSESDLMIQPFLDEITRVGEWSLIFFGMTFSHAVRKMPKNGDYRVQEQHGGYIVIETPPDWVIDKAYEILSKTDDTLTYARVDGCEVNGEFLLIELELIEPELFFRTSKDAASKCADAIQRLA